MIKHRKRVVSSYGTHSIEYSYFKLAVLDIRRTNKILIKRELHSNFITFIRNSDSKINNVVIYHYAIK